MEEPIYSKRLFMAWLLIMGLVALCLLTWTAAYTAGILAHILLIVALTILMVKLIRRSRTF